MELVYRNVNQAFVRLVNIFQDHTCSILEQPSRNGLVLRADGPVMVTYLHSRERVLFNRARDCNPFFHLFESLWMLAGRNDVAPLKHYVSTIEDFSDDGKTFHGAYGHRWRGQGTPFDQLKEIVDQLQRDPNSRRCVLQMWNSGSDLFRQTKDKPCNTHAYFSLRCVDESKGTGHEFLCWYLDITICNRSNDLIWGMLGANVVHFSILQEYLAACIGVEVGKYCQFTNNLHVYVDKWKPDEWLRDAELDRYQEACRAPAQPLVKDPAVFDQECKEFVENIDGEFTEPFLRSTAQPMMAAFRRHKRRQYVGDQGALELIERVQSFDWRVAGRNWLQRRKENWERKSHVSQTSID